MSVEFLNGKVTLYAGDCIDVLAGLPANSVDSVVCDPPYHLTSGNAVYDFRGYDEDERPSSKAGGLRARRTKAGGFMGKKWDGGDIAFQPATWAAVLRVLKPGGHMVAFSGTRTYHRMAVAIEDAGFEIRDQLAWMYGSGFPKSHDVSKGIDKAAGARGHDSVRFNTAGGGLPPIRDSKFRSDHPDYVKPVGVTDAAREWQGWGTALKPAWEPICLARKPLIGTVAANVLEWGTGAINVDGCRVEGQAQPFGNGRTFAPGTDLTGTDRGEWIATKEGRWPANIIHDGSDEVLAGFPETAGQIGGNNDPNGSMGYHGGASGISLPGVKDSGSAARYFYTAKADSEDRLGSKHPTVKPLDLMQYLCRLITPPGGTVLDPFAGTGTTGEAAWREGFKAILIEREAEYQADIARRMELAVLPTKRAAVAKTKNNLMGAEGTPLFGGAA